ncbi:IclR family transcriptional regulator [Williamsia sterculiae]|uniref:Glycerol operon regulatory protein n=1 Tax=Williamsia sterculiae TaxID=1344003 RepID=A0A1N7ED73_9NOCA|nr:IclR family transcriptional regulator [Williamsia sterculiae]SIR85918.1 transcriptional regulator, IclR family [Williamsia sterculiae]
MAPGDGGVAGGDTGSKGASIQSVDRALEVLELLARLGEGGVSEIAERIGVHKSTISRLISVLESRGYVEQVSDRGKYRLGFTIIRLAGSTMASRDLARESKDVGEALAAECGETVNLAVLDGDRAVNITQAAGSAGIALRTWVGQNSPAHATSSGKSLLSGLSDERLTVVLPERLEGFTATTIVERSTLLAQLQQVRSSGWSSVRDELEDGLTALAAPVRDHTNAVVAALSISGPSFRLGPEAVEGLADRVRVAAAEISTRLGHAG